MKIKITKAKPEDARGIREVLRDTWIATYPNKEFGITVEEIKNSYKDLLTDDSIKKYEERIRTLPENIHFFVAKENEKIVGVHRVVIHPDKNELQTLYVLPEYQNKGIGKALWEEGKKLWIEVNPLLSD